MLIFTVTFLVFCLWKLPLPLVFNPTQCNHCWICNFSLFYRSHFGPCSWPAQLPQIHLIILLWNLMWCLNGWCFPIPHVSSYNYTPYSFWRTFVIFLTHTTTVVSIQVLTGLYCNSLAEGLGNLYPSSQILTVASVKLIWFLKLYFPYTLILFSNNISLFQWWLFYFHSYRTNVLPWH